jgi:hypothetical protein
MTISSDLQYFPAISFFNDLIKSTHIVFYSSDLLPKQSFANRTIIAGANGCLTLTIPLTGGRHGKKPVGLARIHSKENWQIRHWRSLYSAYNRSPWFSFYAPGLERIYQQPFEHLKDWNIACLDWACRQLNWLGKIELLDNEGELKMLPEPIRDLRGKIRPGNYQEQEAPQYQQVFEEKWGFLPNLSILDLLFCQGKRARSYLDT